MSAIFSCREAVRLATEALDSPLSMRGRIELRMHLAMCSACRAYRRQVGALDRLVRGRGRNPESDLDEVLTPEARERIRLALRRSANGSV